MEKVYRLYGFSDSRVIVITRGETMEQAMEYATRDNGVFPRGVTVYPLDYLPINAKDLYNRNHADGWLKREPFWLTNKRHHEAIQKDSGILLSEVIQMLAEKETNMEQDKCQHTCGECYEFFEHSQRCGHPMVYLNHGDNTHPTTKSTPACGYFHPEKKEENGTV